jgi:phage major head subunit gpT-like protein
MLHESRLRAAARSFRALFFQALEQDQSYERRMCSLLSMEMPSTGDVESYEWLGDIPGMQEWIGERPMKDLAAYGQLITNKSWANGIKVKRATIEDDRLGQVMPRIRSLAEAYWRKRWELVLAVITGGKTLACYDGTYFIGSSHYEKNSGTQVNLDTDLLDATAYAEARQKLSTFVTDEGRVLNLRGTHLLVCPALEATAREILIASQNSAGATNIWSGTAELVVVPGLDGGGMTANKAWALCDLSKPLKPVIDQIREPVQFAAQEQPTNEAVFLYDEFRYGANYRGNSGPGLWQLIYMSDGSGS